MIEVPNQSAEYAKLRAELLEAEIGLKEQRERVAELRRKLPADTPLREDYVLKEGPRDLQAGDAPIVERRVSELFEGDKPLVLMQFMFGRKQEQPCPMCTMWADGYDGAVRHLEQRVSFGVVVAGDITAFRAHARSRGWRNLRLLSSEGTSFKRDFGMENEEGAQMPGVSVFVRGEDGAPRHFYTGCAMMTPDHFRGMDLLSPVWSFFDLTPEGRGSFFPSFDY